MELSFIQFFFSNIFKYLFSSVFYIFQQTKVANHKVYRQSFQESTDFIYQPKIIPFYSIAFSDVKYIMFFTRINVKKTGQQGGWARFAHKKGLDENKFTFDSRVPHGSLIYMENGKYSINSGIS